MTHSSSQGFHQLLCRRQVPRGSSPDELLKFLKLSTSVTRRSSNSTYCAFGRSVFLLELLRGLEVLHESVRGHRGAVGDRPRWGSHSP
jgi:hypothetical protein